MQKKIGSNPLSPLSRERDLGEGKKLNFLGRAFVLTLPDLTQAKCYKFFGRAFGQVKLALTQRLLARSLFGDWGGDYKFFSRAFDQALPDLTQATGSQNLVWIWFGNRDGRIFFKQIVIKINQL